MSLITHPNTKRMDRQDKNYMTFKIDGQISEMDFSSHKILEENESYKLD